MANNCYSKIGPQLLLKIELKTLFKNAKPSLVYDFILSKIGLFINVIFQ